jgi:hypothetical protein
MRARAGVPTGDLQKPGTIEKGQPKRREAAEPAGPPSPGGSPRESFWKSRVRLALRYRHHCRTHTLDAHLPPKAEPRKLSFSLPA